MSETDGGSPGQRIAITDGGDRCLRAATEDGFSSRQDDSDPTRDDADGTLLTDGGAEQAQSETEGTEGDESDGGGGQTESATEGTESATEGTDTTGEDDQSASETDGTESAESDAETDQDDATDSATDQDDEDVTVGNAGSLFDVRETVSAVAIKLIDGPLDSVIEIEQNDAGKWRAVVEVIERRAVPDTQDILGRYEVLLDDPETVTGYRRLDRYRRGDTDDSDTVG